MKVEIKDNPTVKKLIRLKNKRCPDSIRWYIKATYWDDGDYEMELRTSWGGKIHSFFYRHSIGKYFYDIEEASKYRNMEEMH